MPLRAHSPGYGRTGESPEGGIVTRPSFPLERGIFGPMDVELEPEQPPEVARAVAELLAAEEERPPDPWWQAGLDESLRT